MSKYIKTTGIAAGVFIAICFLAFIVDKILEKNSPKAPPVQGNCFIEQNYGTALQWESVQKETPPLKIIVDKECVTHIEPAERVQFDTLRYDIHQDLYLPFTAEVKGYDEVSMTVYATVEVADHIRQMMVSQEDNVVMTVANYGVYNGKDLLLIMNYDFQKEAKFQYQ